MNPPAEQLIRDYLNRVSVAAGDSLGSEGRRVLLAKTREHIERRAGNPALANAADVARVLAALGPPGALAERARKALAGTSVPVPVAGYPGNGRAPQGGPEADRWHPRLVRVGSSAANGGPPAVERPPAGRPSGPSGPRLPGRPVRVAARRGGVTIARLAATMARRASPIARQASPMARRASTATARQVRRRPLEAFVIALQGMGGLIFPPLWLLGALIALPSRAWDFRDKWTGLGGPVGLVVVGTWIIATLNSRHHTVASYLHQVWASGGYLSRIAAVLGAVYLGWRLQRGRRELMPPWLRPPRAR